MKLEGTNNMPIIQDKELRNSPLLTPQEWLVQGLGLWFVKGKRKTSWCYTKSDFNLVTLVPNRGLLDMAMFLLTITLLFLL